MKYLFSFFWALSIASNYCGLAFANEAELLERIQRLESRVQVLEASKSRSGARFAMVDNKLLVTVEAFARNI